MDQIHIQGGVRLAGTVEISGAKNAALPGMVAALLTDEPVRLHNIPMVRDVQTMLRLLKRLGGANASLEPGRFGVRVQTLGQVLGKQG